MYHRPVVLGIFSERNPHRSTLQDLFGRFGNNTGNILFSESILRNIKGASAGSLGYTEAEFSGHDCIILAAANWLNPGLDFGAVADRLARTQLPIVVVGLGAQSDLSYSIPKLPDGTVRLIQLASERSNQLGVRGDFTANVLSYYGVKNVTVTGCPSLLLSGKIAPSIRTYEDKLSSNVAIGGTRHGFNQTDSFQTYIYREAIRKNIDIVLQSELADMYYATGRTNNIELLERASRICSQVYGRNKDDTETFLAEHAKVFFDIDAWIQYMSGKSLYVGTRLHGAIASLLSGTPAILICHDSRSGEAARALNIPHILYSDVNIAKPLDFGRIYRQEEMTAFVASYSDYRNRLCSFFNENGLEVHDSPV